MHPRWRVPKKDRDVWCHFFESTRISLSNIDISRKIGIHRYSLFFRSATREIFDSVLASYRRSSVNREDPMLVLGAIREQLPTTARLGRPASTGVHRGTSRTGRRHTLPSQHHGADLCHPRARPLTLSWTRPIGACESPPIALRGRHRARIKIFDFS